MHFQVVADRLLNPDISETLGTSVVRLPSCALLFSLGATFVHV